MGEVEKFVHDHRPTLLRYLDGKAPASPEEPSAVDYVMQVIDEWSALFAGRPLDPPSRCERTFWFALYLLEELVEYPTPRKPLPYEGMLMQDLAEVTEVLRAGENLPERYFASRPGENFDADDSQG